MSDSRKINVGQVKNQLIYNPAVGIISSVGDTTELEVFVNDMKPEFIHSFFGSTLNIEELKVPLMAYRASAKPSAFWTTVLPQSSLQMALDLAMHLSVYPDLPFSYPGNKGVLIYLIPAGTIVVRGPAAPQGGFPGMGEQIFIKKAEASQVKSVTWAEWKLSCPMSVRLKGNWERINLESSNLDAKRIACTVQSAASDKIATPNVKPKFHTVVKEYAANSTKLSVPFEPSLQPPMKIWDVKINSAKTVIEPSPMPWRSPFSEGRRAPIFQRLNYSGIAKTIAKISAPVLVPLDAYARTLREVDTHPNHSSLGNSFAVTTSIGFDLGLFSGLCKLAPSGIAAGVVIATDTMCNVANDLRHIPAESARNNRDLFMASIFSSGFSPEVEMKLIQEFDEGKPWTRDYNENTATITKAIFKPFEILYDVKTFAVDTGRATGDALMEPVTRVIETHKERKKVSVKKENQIEEKVIKLASTIDDLVSPAKNSAEDKKLTDFFKQVDIKPSQLQPLPKMQTSLPRAGVSLLDNANGIMTFNVPIQSGVLNSELHGFLNTINTNLNIIKTQELPLPNLEIEQDIPLTIKRSNAELYPPHRNSEIINAKQEKPFITNISLAPVGGGIGIVASLASEGVIGVGIGNGGFIVSVSANFGPGFLSALGSATGIGAVVAGVLMTVQFFYNRHYKHIQHKINKAIKLSKLDTNSISDSLTQLSQKLQVENNINSHDLINETQSLISQISVKIAKEKSRAEYAKKHKNRKAADAHYGISREYQQRKENLSQLKNSFELDEIQKKFVESHQAKSSVEMIELAKQLTNKQTFAGQDIAQIKGLRHIIVNKILHLSSSGKINEAQNLLKETFNLQYYLPGEINELAFGVGLGKLDRNTDADIKTINDGVKNINTVIASGENPLNLLHSLINNIADKRIKWENKKINRHHHRHKSSNYVSSEQWDARIKVLDTLKQTLESQAAQFKDGNKACDLKLTGLTNLLKQLSTHTNSASQFWIDELYSLNKGLKSLSEEETILFKGVASHHLLNNVMMSASQGNFEHAQHIINELAILIPEYKDLSQKYAAKLDELKPFLNEKASFWLNRIKMMNAIPNENKNEMDALELLIAEQFTINEVFSQAILGEFDDANYILENFKSVSPQQEKLANSLLVKISQLKPYYQDADYCLNILKTTNIKQKKNKKLMKF